MRLSEEQFAALTEKEIDRVRTIRAFDDELTYAEHRELQYISQLADLRIALRPFADKLQARLRWLPDSEDWEKTNISVTVGDLRRAAKALEAK